MVIQVEVLVAIIVIDADLFEKSSDLYRQAIGSKGTTRLALTHMEKVQDIQGNQYQRLIIESIIGNKELKKKYKGNYVTF